MKLRAAQIFLYVLCLILMSPGEAFAQKIIPQSQQHITLSYAPLVKQTAPTVVNIYTQKKVRVQTSPFLSDPFFSRFFGKAFKGPNRERVENTLGSGVIISKDGLIITNNHVIDNASDIRIVLHDRSEYSAKTLLTDEKSDLALLKITPDEDDTLNLPFIQIGNPDSLEVGDLVLAIGNPFGVGQTVTSGIVSALARTAVGISNYEFFIQTDAAINPGNSGGALINMNGELVGINTAIFSKGGGSNGIGFATPASMASAILANHEAGHDRVIRPWLGATGQTITADIAESLGLTSPKGVLIKNVYEGSPADKAGLKTGDVIVQVGTHTVHDGQSLLFHTATKPINQRVAFTLIDGSVRYVTMQPAPETPARDIKLIEGNTPMNGAIVANLSPALAEELGISRYKGVVITDIQLRTYANRIFQKNDILLSINDKKVTSTKQLEGLLQLDVKSWQFTFLRGGRTLNVTVGR